MPPPRGPRTRGGGRAGGTTTGPPAARPRAVHPALVAVGVVLLALNLRTTVASLPPLLGRVERDLGLPGPAAGLLTALPVLCMAWFAPAAQRLARRVGAETVALGAVALVAAGNGLRLAGAGTAVLFAATFLAGLGVSACGVLLPGIVKASFPARAGAATGAYTVAMMLGSALAAGLAVPLERALGSWQASLAVWALPAALAALAWAPVPAGAARARAPAPAPAGMPWRSRTAWLLAAFLSLQGSLAYAWLAWLAPAYQARGWAPAAAGALLGASNLAQLAAALVLPALADRSPDRRPPLMGAVACTALGTAWLVALPDALPWAAACLLGFGLGGGFSLALVLLVDYAGDPGASARLTAMAFLVSYTAAALAPVLVGALRDATGGFAVPFGLLGALALAELVLAARLRPGRRVGG